MGYGYEVGDSIHGHRINAEAGKVSDPVVSQEYQTQSAVDSADRKTRLE